jgi:hypothetical protein
VKAAQPGRAKGIEQASAGIEKPGAGGKKVNSEGNKVSAATRLAGDGFSKPQTPAEKAARIKALTAKDKAARDKKKRAEAKRAALNAGKHKPAPTRPTGAAVAAQGQ